MKFGSDDSGRVLVIIGFHFGTSNTGKSMLTEPHYGYARGPRFELWHDDGLSGKSDSAVPDQVVATVPKPLPMRPKGRLLVAVPLLLIVGVVGYQIWNTFFLNRTYGTVIERTLELSAPWDGLLQSISVSEGSRMQRGDVIFTVENLELTQRLARAEDDLKIARAEYESEVARLNWLGSWYIDRYQESTADYFEAQGRLLVDQATLNDLRVEHQRVKKLVAQNAISVETLDSITFRLQGQTGKVENMQTAVNELKKRVELSSGLADADTEQAQLKAHLNKVDAAKAEIVRLHELLGQGQVRAATDGIVLRQHRYQGETIRSSEPVLILSEKGSQEIVIYMRQGQTGSLEIGQTVDVIVQPFSERIGCRVVRTGDQYSSVPDHLARHFRHNENLLPVYLKGIDSQRELKPGAVVQVPF